MQVTHFNGWLHTGDLGIMHDDGCIHLTGRSRDVIIRGGENIHPREVEEFLYTHPKVDEVQVVRIPNARLGEIVAAWVRQRPGVEATNVAPALLQHAGRRGFVTGHDFSRAEDASENELGFSPCCICFQPIAL